MLFDIEGLLDAKVLSYLYNLFVLLLLTFEVMPLIVS